MYTFDQTFKFITKILNQNHGSYLIFLLKFQYQTKYETIINIDNLSKQIELVFPRIRNWDGDSGVDYIKKNQNKINGQIKDLLTQYFNAISIQEKKSSFDSQYYPKIKFDMFE
ncbi:hypothetical protein PPERSA_00789 [Pseudocohnilembus persalinus]|uniref:Uncharacterized protein n=1 Tax=Pseudocohnilembus persalinus TaxID=266149 RepID=A0A0V0QFR1_PSEPJ|nr:hypothetical protein PPERSA_00789 [Pseudocohnilembus persalinus]|eukprot:KRX01041.1 hypothetical protein PPERSA_00789 [Pseudocohnilembus persalinus]